MGVWKGYVCRGRSSCVGDRALVIERVHVRPENGLVHWKDTNCGDAAATDLGGFTEAGSQAKWIAGRTGSPPDGRIY